MVIMTWIMRLTVETMVTLFRGHREIEHLMIILTQAQHAMMVMKQEFLFQILVILIL